MTIKIVLIVLVVVLAVLLVGFLLGPRVQMETALRTVSLPRDLDGYLRDGEGRFGDIIPGTEKTIVWATENGRKTPLSIVYLHGFSASRQETRPMADRVAESLGANLFYTRFTGHGRPGNAMASVTVNDWINDAQEALEIGRRIGERVVLIGVSTGGSAATWLAARKDADDIAALVLMSPNYGPADWRSSILLWPWGEEIAKLMVGDEYGWEPQNEDHARFWTTRYPTRALLSMMGVAHLGRASELERMVAPTLILYSREDRLVSWKQIERAFERMGAKRKRLERIEQTGDGSSHVLAGDILSPDTTDEVVDRIVSFVRGERTEE
ncbi:MAG: hypothetical protein CBD18_05190 [Opitutales bacterium TMED158]|nr:MAG: hypothetical protein CBD18_05190 [Opitutales bacterium TMED158]